MIKLIWISFAVVLLFLGIACREAFQVEVVQTPGAPPTIRFYSSELFGSSDVEVKQLTIGRVVAQNKPAELVWSIRRKPATTTRIPQITYGIPPVGFEEDMPARPLLLGEEYDILASSASAGIGGARFVRE